MANISLYSLYTQKQSEFGMLGAGGARFDVDFITATNRAINKINRDADLSSVITRVDDKEDTVGLDEKYEDILSDGISFNLMKMGRRPARGAESLVASLERNFVDGIESLYNMLKNDQQNADTSDNTYDIVGLGKLGE